MPADIPLQGAMTALITPFADGQVDWDALGRLIDDQVDRGIQGLVPCGTTGESPTLTHEEHDRVIEFTIRRAAGRVPVIAGTGSNSTAEALRLTAHAKDAGADACLVVNPYYNKPTQHGMYEHAARLAEVGLPIVLYNHPGRTGVALSPETIVKMYEEIDMVVAVKEATGKLATASEVAARCDMTILSGDDPLTMPLCAVGGRGAISVASNLVPDRIRSLCDALDAGDLDAARVQHLRLYPLVTGLLVETNPIPIKAAMAMAGLIRNELRLPLTPLSESLRPALARLIEDYGIEVKQP